MVSESHYGFNPKLLPQGPIQHALTMDAGTKARVVVTINILSGQRLSRMPSAAGVTVVTCGDCPNVTGTAWRIGGVPITGRCIRPPRRATPINGDSG